MKRLLLVLLLIFSVSGYSQSAVTAKKLPTAYKKHNTTLVDEYAWFENHDTKEVTDWVDAQNTVLEAHAKEVKDAYSGAWKIKEYDFYSSNPMPSKKGKYFFSLYRKDKDKPASLYYRKALNTMPVELFNPYKTYNDNNVFIDEYSPSKNSKYLACEINTTGSDKHEIKFIDIDNRNTLAETLTDVKYTNIKWNNDKGIFYSKNNNNMTFAVDSTYQLYYHEIGTAQIKDKLIFDTSESQNSFSYFKAGNKLILTENSKKDQRKNYYYISLTDPELKPVKFLENESSDFILRGIYNEKVYFSKEQYDWGEIRTFELNDRTTEKSLIPQIYTHLLMEPYFFEDYIVCKYKNGGKFYMNVYDYNGTFIRKFDAPYGMTFSVRFYNAETKDLFVSFYSYTIPFQNYRLNLANGQADHYFDDYMKPKPSLFPLNYFETKSTTYKSRDNKDILITIIHKKGITLDGNNPTLLDTYGGFGVVHEPHYYTALLYFMEKGGVYAFAEIRGGGEKGKKWHTEGKGLKKVNSCNDFIDAAEFLIKEKYTSPNKLAITGASHGGMVVGAAITQRPDLFKVAVPIAGKYDLIRSRLYTNGENTAKEYGDPEISEEFDSLLKISPYHNIKEDVNYPTTLIMANENDDRVTPFQSYKFAAKLQNRPNQKNPIYLKTNKEAGHNGKVATYASRLNEQAFFIDFILYHLNK